MPKKMWHNLLKGAGTTGYEISGESTATTFQTIYINNVATDVEVINGVFKFPYNIGQELTAIRFVGSNPNTTLTKVNLKKADLFASVSHLDYCFMNCTALTEIDFGKKAFKTTLTATDTFKGCEALTTIKIDATSEWPANVDLSDCPLTKASVWQFVNALKTYTSGLHHIVVSDDMWDSLTTAEKSELEDACEMKYWSIHAPYHIRGTSTNVGGTEIFNIQFINDGALTPSTAETITCAVDAQGNWDYAYSGKHIYRLKEDFSTTKNHLVTVEFTETLDECIDFYGANYSAFWQCGNLQSVIFAPNTKINWDRLDSFFYGCQKLVSVNFEDCTFKQPISKCERMFWSNGQIW